MIMGLVMLQNLVPVPPRPPVVLDHQIACNLFGADAALGRISATTVAESAALARLTMSGRADGIALPPARASAWSERGMVAVRSRSAQVEYNWMFQVPSGTGTGDGLVTVSARAGSGPVRYVATGICTVTSSKAAYQ